jgi:hypothetical protein
MAKARKRKGRKSRCKVVTVCGKRRRICWGKKGITSNKPASGGTRKKSTRKASKRKGAKKRCQFGVNKRTKKCLKRPRRK